MKMTAARRRPGRLPRAKATRSGWARPTRRASSCPTSSRSIGNSAPAACCRRPRADAKPRRKFSLQSGALNPLMPGRLPIHTLNPALAVLKDAASWPTLHGGDGSADPKRIVHALRDVPRTARRRHRPPALGARAPGRTAHRAPLGRASTAILSTHCQRRTSRSFGRHLFRLMGHPAPWCCTRT